MDVAVFLLAAHHKGDPTVQAIGTLVIVVMCIITLIRTITAQYDVVTKSGAPYCPRCNRQVSYRREHCRSCGYHFVSHSLSGGRAHGSSGSRADPTLDWARREAVALQEEAARKARVARAVQIEATRQTKAEETAARRAARDEKYRAMGIEAGPMAWYWALPDLSQAMILGLALAVPTAAVLVVLFVLTRQ